MSPPSVVVGTMPVAEPLVGGDPSAPENALDTAPAAAEKERSLKDMISAVNFNNYRQVENGSFYEISKCSLPLSLYF